MKLYRTRKPVPAWYSTTCWVVLLFKTQGSRIRMKGQWPGRRRKSRLGATEARPSAEIATSVIGTHRESLGPFPPINNPPELQRAIARPFLADLAKQMIGRFQPHATLSAISSVMLGHTRDARDPNRPLCPAMSPPWLARRRGVPFDLAGCMPTIGKGRANDATGTTHAS